MAKPEVGSEAWSREVLGDKRYEAIRRQATLKGIAALIVVAGLLFAAFKGCSAYVASRPENSDDAFFRRQMEKCKQTGRPDSWCRKLIYEDGQRF